MCCFFSLDLENTLPKHNIGSLMPFRYFFIGLRKRVIVETRHQFTNALSTFFFVRYHFNKKAKVPMDVRRWVLLSSIDFPSTTLTTDSTAKESVVEYVICKIWPIVIAFLTKLGIPINKFLVIDPMVQFLVQVKPSRFLIRASRSWILIPTTKSWFSVPSTENENFMPIPFSKIVMLNY